MAPRRSRPVSQEAAEAGFKGIEKGGKFPNDAAAMQAVLGKHGLELVSGWFSGELLNRGVEAEIEALRPHLELLKACGAKVVIWAETSGTVQGKRSVPVADRPVMSEGDWPGYLEEHRQARRLDGRERRADGVPPSHGHGGREGARDRPAAGRHARDRGPALRHRPSSPSPARIRPRWREWAKRINHVHAKDVRPDVMRRVHAERMSFSMRWSPASTRCPATA